MARAVSAYACAAYGSVSDGSTKDRVLLQAGKARQEEACWRSSFLSAKRAGPRHFFDIALATHDKSVHPAHGATAQAHRADARRALARGNTHHKAHGGPTLHAQHRYKASLPRMFSVAKCPKDEAPADIARAKSKTSRGPARFASQKHERNRLFACKTRLRFPRRPDRCRRRRRSFAESGGCKSERLFVAVAAAEPPPTTTTTTGESSRHLCRSSAQHPQV